MENTPLSESIAYTITPEYYVSTAIWRTTTSFGLMDTWETFIWNKVEGKRGKLVKQYYHRSEQEAIDFHFAFSKKLTARKKKAQLN